MKNLVELTTNKLLNEIVDTAVRQALIQQVKCNEEYEKQREPEDAGQPFNFTVSHILREGAHHTCEVLWKIFGGYPYEHHNAIEKIAARGNNSHHLGYDCRDYVEMYMEALEAK